MGRNASHVALECTLQSHPNMVILGEEVSVSKLTLFDLTKQICHAVQTRAEQDKNHGVILLAEGLIESILEVYALLKLVLLTESDESAQLSQIETAKLLAQFVEAEMNKRLAMMSVKRFSLGPGVASIGKPVIHPASIDLKGKAYEYASVCAIVKPGCSQDVLKAALSAMPSVTEILTVMSASSYNGKAPF